MWHACIEKNTYYYAFALSDHNLNLKFQVEFNKHSKQILLKLRLNKEVRYRAYV